MSTPLKTRILIADDHQVVRRGLVTPAVFKLGTAS